MQIRNRFFYLEMAAMILTAALAVPEAAPSSCADFAPGASGAFQGEDTHLTLPPGAPTVVINTAATGTGTHLGRFTLRREITGDLTNFSAAGSAEWIAAKWRQYLYDHFGAGRTVGCRRRVTQSHRSSDDHWGDRAIHRNPGQLYRGVVSHSGSQQCSR